MKCVKLTKVSRNMQGSYSIKYVLPALFPDDPSLDYHNLEGVYNGGEAYAAYAAMADMEPVQLEEYREHLFRYCELDTYAMVKVWGKLEEINNLKCCVCCRFERRKKC